MVQPTNTFTAQEKQILMDGLTQLMSVTARAARAAQDKGLHEVANAYHKTNAMVLATKAKAEKEIAVNL